MFGEIALPEGYSPGYLFDMARGKQVDLYGKWNGLTRKRGFLYRESDHSFKKRIVAQELKKRGLIPTHQGGLTHG